jgi:hypothetical protein
MDHERAVVHGSTVDHGGWRPKGSPESGLGAAPVSGSSVTSEVPTMGEDGGAVPEGGWRR